MLKRVLGVLLLLSVSIPVSQAPAASDPSDAAGSKDPALSSRMPGFWIYGYRELEFDRYEFEAGPGKSEAVEGRHRRARQRSSVRWSRSTGSPPRA
jgi:hypothetical protein